ncbi:hypothetical protein DC28_14560 [Spirochaeta lutea]|uniref:histidine kinase n=2 Tax=Spirochaeta lutea TaxID=1480694 RepID=A0A098QTJ8_9SPIO|nr:hypothetical protein DC28_14560 [Spirochaeta lutea]
MLKIGMIITLVMIVPTIALITFLSNQALGVSQTRLLESLNYGKKTLEANLGYKLQQLRGTAIRLSGDPYFLAAVNEPNSQPAPVDVAPSVGVQMWSRDQSLVYNRPIRAMNPFVSGLVSFESVLEGRTQVVHVSEEGLLVFQFLVLNRGEAAANTGGLTENGGALVLGLHTRISHEVFDIVTFSLGQETSIYRVPGTVLEELETTPQSVLWNRYGSQGRIPSELVFTTRFDSYGRRLERLPATIPWFAGLPSSQQSDLRVDAVQEEVLEGVEQYSVYAPLPIGEPGEYVGHISIPKSRFRSSEGPNYLWIVAAAVLFLIIIMTVLIARFLIRPVVDLSDGVENLRRHLREQGPLLQIGIKSDDEIGDLSRSFNQLGAELKASFSQIRSQREEILNYAQTLEERVQERTRELEEARIRAEIANTHKSRFLVNMNHELRTPLNSISGITDLLRFGAYDKTEDLIHALEQYLELHQSPDDDPLSPEEARALDHLDAYLGHLILRGNGIAAFVSYLEDALPALPDYPQLTERVKQLLAEQDRSYLKAYSTIREAGEVLINIIDEVINLSRIESGVIEISKGPQRLSEIINYALVHSESYARSKGKINTLSIVKTIHPDCPEDIMADGQKVKQVLLNLMTNGVKYTNQGRVDLEVKPGNSGRELVFSVRDTGIGIADSDKKVIFTEFGRAFAVRDIEGTGLGLALSKKLVVAHGGKIGFESELGSGSVFWFTLPLENPGQN